MDHDEAVDKHFRAARIAKREGYWQEIYREESYFENQDAPVGEPPEPKGLEKGEFDVLLVNYTDRLAFYKEIKTNGSELTYGRDQLERAKNHFEETDWDIIGSVILER